MALKRLLGCACIFSAGHLRKAYDERIGAWNNNGILVSNHCRWPVLIFLLFYGKDVTWKGASYDFFLDANKINSASSYLITCQEFDTLMKSVSN
ncbi:MAG: hypothetical protein DRG73_11080 [Deltaproteobacteria bacterium]|nr:MAG: hypothetical protein DRG73_11080 [Deltaproteobacteria bacterium]